ncbi:MAG: hypothetical protein ACJZ4I_03145 [Candidatus Pelagibacter sp.]
MLDQDIKIMYNSLLISSGIEQEYRDHPAYTTFLLLGGVFKLLSIFFDNFTIQEIIKSENIDQNLQTLFIIGRIINSIYVFLVAFILFNILKELNIKKNICIFIIFLLLIFQDTYELLFLIRSEILSILMILLFFYFLIKFIKEKKIKYTFISGFFLCLAMLAKIQVIFLFFTFLLCLPFLINYFKSSKNKLIYGKNYYLLNFSFLSLFLLSYIFFQITLGIMFLEELNDPRFYLTNNIDLFFLLIFVIFYSFLIKFLSKKKLANTSEIIILISSVLVGFVLCILFVLFLDLINLIPFNKLNFMRLTNPLEYMTGFTRKLQTNSNILISLLHYLLGFGGLLDIGFNEQKKIPLIFYLDPRIFFRTLQVFFFIILIYFSIKKVKDKKIDYLSIALLVGIFFQHLSFNLRETHGYNMYLFPLYTIVAAVIFNKLKKKLLVIFYLCILVIFISENLMLSNIHKNAFSREPRVYDLCANENIETIRWKNSENYVKNINKNSYLKLVDHPKNWFYKWVNKFAPSRKEKSEFLQIYCNQIKNEKGLRSHSYKLKRE